MPTSGLLVTLKQLLFVFRETGSVLGYDAFRCCYAGFNQDGGCASIGKVDGAKFHMLIIRMEPLVFASFVPRRCFVALSFRSRRIYLLQRWRIASSNTATIMTTPVMICLYSSLTPSWAKPVCRT